LDEIGINFGIVHFAGAVDGGRRLFGSDEFSQGKLNWLELKFEFVKWENVEGELTEWRESGTGRASR
jgi:hypothetical protein